MTEISEAQMEEGFAGYTKKKENIKEDATCKLTKLERLRELFFCSQGAAQLGAYWFNSFEGLALLDLYKYQEELAELSTEVFDNDKGISDKCTPELCDEIRTKLRDYYGAMESFRNIMQCEPIKAGPWEDLVLDMCRRMGHHGYELGTWVDVHPKTPYDLIRRVLHRILPRRMFDGLDLYEEDALKFYTGGGDYDPNDTYKNALARGYGKSGPLVSHAIVRRGQLPPIADSLARLVIAFVGGLFLLVPMIIMTFVKNSHDRLIIVVTSVIVFSLTVALTSVASNQELVAATAGYTAVLVVYVGTTS